MMSLLSLGEQTWWGYKPYGTIVYINSSLVPIFGPLSLTCQIIYLYQNFRNLPLNVLGTIFSMLPMTALVNIKIRVHKTKKYENLMKSFITNIHLHNYKEEDSVVKATIIKIERYSRSMAYCVIFLVNFSWMLWSVIPFVNNLNNKEAIHNKTMLMQSCLYMWMPIEYEYDFKKWLITHFINIYLMGVGCALLAIPDIINYTMAMHLIGHVILLKHKIVSSFPTELNDKEVKQKLKDLVEYHCFILKLFKDVESVFGINISTNYFINLLIDSLLLYQLMNQEKGDKTSLLFGITIVICMGGLIIMSFILEEIRKQSDDLPESLYGISWENWNVSNQKSLLIILAQLQPELAFVGAGGLRTGVTPMVAIIKSTISYYLMLKSTI
uniref:Odorant receptor n=1 Tax=Eogystia hippophaecolus TaxID=1206364 RepID=A0A1B3P5R2_EOGHI|nr:odorant receptor [Eogystia hippophaecolus]